MAIPSQLRSRPVVRPLYRGRPGRSRRRAFSLIEIVGVVVLVAVLSLAAFATFSGSTKPGGDTEAKASLVLFAEAQTTSFVSDGTPASLDELSSGDAGVVWVSGVSTSSDTVSVIVSGTASGAAASNGNGSCWLLRLDTEPGPTSEPEIWAVGDDVSCVGATALALTASGGALGRNPNNPQVIE